jgi:hypothetical protein
MRTNDRFAWLLISAAALGAMLAGHACELWLENMHAFGDQQAGYHHVGQGFVAELAIILLIAVVAGILRFVARRVHRGSAQGDNLVPALHAIASGGFTRLVCRLIGLQIFALVTTELCEQRLSGYQGNVLASIAGPGHASALAVHLLLGSIIAFAVYRFSRFAAVRTRVLLEAVIAFVQWATVRTAYDGLLRLRLAFAPSAFTRHVSLIALGLANRPPPVLSAQIA